MALPCASARRSLLLLEVFDNCSCVQGNYQGAERDRFCLGFLGDWGVGHSESREKVGSVISDFRPPSVTDSSETALRRLLASRAIGGYSFDF